MNGECGGLGVRSQPYLIAVVEHPTKDEWDRGCRSCFVLVEDAWLMASSPKEAERTAKLRIPKEWVSWFGEKHSLRTHFNQLEVFVHPFDIGKREAEAE